MLKTALVTGAFGFVGRHVARQLASDGWQVVGMGHGSWTRQDWQTWGIADWHTSDITLETLVTYAGNPEVVVHCAGSGSVGFSMTHPYQDFQRTVASTLAVLEFARLYASRAQVVYPSSAGVYGVVQKLPIAETESLSPASPYGIHKRLAENLFESYSKYFGISTAVVRLFSVYGVGLRKQLLWDASQKITRGENDFYGSGEEIRDWLHVEDAASLLIKAAGNASKECPMVNGGSGVGVTVREALTELFARYGRADAPIFSGAARGGDPDGYVADISRAEHWGWQPRIQRNEGLREYAEWFVNGAP